MSDLTLCEQLLHAGDAEAREALFADADAARACVEHLLATARQQVQSDPEQARQRAALAIALAEQRFDLESSAHAWRIQAQSHRAQGDHAQAVTSFVHAAERAARAGNPLLAAQVQIGHIDSLGWLGRIGEALPLARRLEATLSDLGAFEDAAKAAVNMGSLHLRGDQHALALACYERAHSWLADSADPISLARVQFNKASTLMELNRMDEALSLFETCRVPFAERSMDMDVALVDANVGFLHHISGRPAAAIAALARARESFAGWNQHVEAATCDADMGEAYRELNLHPEALECYERAIVRYASLSIAYERARAETGRAAILMASGRHEDAEQGLERADALFGAHRNQSRRAHVRLLRAHLLRGQGHLESARHEAQAAGKTLRRKGLRGWAAEAQFLTLELDFDAENADNADNAHGNATDKDSQSQLKTIRALHHVRRTAREWGRGWLECRAEQALGRAYARRNLANRALKHFRAGAHILEQARTLIAPEDMHVSFLRDKLSVYEDVVAALLARGRKRDIAEALEYVERAKSRLLLDRVQQTLEGRAPGAPYSLQTQEQLERLRAELSRAYHRLHALDEGDARRLGGTEAEGEIDLRGLEQAYQDALRTAEAPYLDGVQHALTLSPVAETRQLQQALQSDEMLVEYYVTQGHVCAFVVTPNHVHSLCNFADLSDVLHLARRLRYQLERAGWAAQTHQRHAQRFHVAIQEVLSRLYELLWRPLADLLTAEKIVLVPHGELHGLPFHAFFDGQQYALDCWEFVYAPSGAVWRAGVQQQETTSKYGTINHCSGSSLLVGVPEPGIEHVAEEVEALARLLPAPRLLCREQATLAALLAELPHCRILHIATHALFRADNPLFSGLKLADGWLLSRDLYQMRFDCDLATLSACQTGVAFVEAGDELFGLIRGFLAGGARSVAASLWPADDQATAALMEPFYQGLLQGLSKAAALRHAQQHLRAHFPHPYHWAAFALIGERGKSASSEPTFTVDAVIHSRQQGEVSCAA